jgi:hypothetical protein
VLYCILLFPCISFFGIYKVPGESSEAEQSKAKCKVPIKQSAKYPYKDKARYSYKDKAHR